MSLGFFFYFSIICCNSFVFIQFLVPLTVLWACSYFYLFKIQLISPRFWMMDIKKYLNKQMYMHKKNKRNIVIIMFFIYLFFFISCISRLWEDPFILECYSSSSLYSATWTLNFSPLNCLPLQNINSLILKRFVFSLGFMASTAF